MKRLSISIRSLFILPLVLAGGLLLLGLQADSSRASEFELPDMGDSSSGLLSVQEEERIGELFMGQVRSTAQVIEHPEVSAYMQDLGHRLAARSNDRTRRFDFFMISAEPINAFAGPGGKIGINSGLMLTTETESELASVLAHEIAHVTQRHLPRAFEQADRMGMPTLAAMLGAIILGAYNAEAGVAALSAVQAGAIQSQINFTRANEKEADRVGMQILHESDFDPAAMPAFFERLHTATRYTTNDSIPEFLRTHPVTLNRITDSRNRAARYPTRPVPQSAAFHRVRARLVNLTTARPQQALDYFEARLSSGDYADRDAERYGHAIALARVGRLDEARAEIAKLRKADAQVPEYLLLEAEIELVGRDFPRALQILQEGMDLFPRSPLLTPVYGETLLLNGRAKPATQVLHDYVQRHRAGPRLYEILARAAGAAGEVGLSYRMLAEHHALYGRIETAMAQLRRAMDLPNIGFIEVSRAEARLEQLKRVRELQEKYF